MSDERQQDQPKSKKGKKKNTRGNSGESDKKNH